MDTSTAPRDLAKMGAFERQMASVTASEELGFYSADLSAEWNCPIVPQGGMLTAVVGRALELERELGASTDDGGETNTQTLRSIQVVFAEPVAAGPAVIEAEMIRRGRSMSQAAAKVRSASSERGASALAVFGAPRRGDQFQVVNVPDLPPPDRCWSWREIDFTGTAQHVDFPYWQHVERRNPPLLNPFDPHPGQQTENLSWFRFDEIPFRADGTWDPLALVALCDMMPGAVFEFLGDAAGDLYGPSADFTVHLFGPARGEWLASRNRCRIAGEGYASVEMELFDGPNLVAYATQVMYFAYPKFFEERSQAVDVNRAVLRQQNAEFLARYWGNEGDVR
jgi:hypothetical protein